MLRGKRMRPQHLLQNGYSPHCRSYCSNHQRSFDRVPFGIDEARSRMQNSPASMDILESLREARSRTLDLVADLDDNRLMGPRIRIVNPLRWEIGHVAYFQEFWCLRHFRRRQAMLANGD